jgi:hypothetical protein
MAKIMECYGFYLEGYFLSLGEHDMLCDIQQIYVIQPHNVATVCDIKDMIEDINTTRLKLKRRRLYFDQLDEKLNVAIRNVLSNAEYGKD